jgi:hypothetical protein
MTTKACQESCRANQKSGCCFHRVASLAEVRNSVATSLLFPGAVPQVYLWSPSWRAPALSIAKSPVAYTLQCEKRCLTSPTFLERYSGIWYSKETHLLPFTCSLCGQSSSSWCSRRKSTVGNRLRILRFSAATAKPEQNRAQQEAQDAKQESLPSDCQSVRSFHRSLLLPCMYPVFEILSGECRNPQS